MKKLLALPILVILAASTGCGITASSLNRGFADFEKPRQHGLERDTVLSLGPAVMRIAARYADDDPQTQALLRSLDGVRVSVYRVGAGADREAIAGQLADAARQLQEQDWVPVVQVNEPDSRVHILTRGDSEQLYGLAIMTIDDEELVYVNVMGDIEPAQLAQLAGSLPLDDNGAFKALNPGAAAAD